MLVFAPWNTPTIFDIFISSYPTRAHPAQKRGLPANAIYRYAKFAFLHWDLDSFEWLTMGAVDRIEQEVFVRLKSSGRLWTCGLTKVAARR